MPHDPEKAKERRKRHREKKKIERLGPDAAGVDLRGKHGNHRKGPHHHQWSDDRMVSAEGYIKIRVGDSHPLADPNGYAYEHLVIWCSAGNPRPEAGQLLHHKNEVRGDNRLENLELLTRQEHNRLHLKSRPRDPVTGRLTPRAA